MKNTNSNGTSETRLGPVILACDDRYAMPLAVTMRSVVEANKPDWPIDFYILSSGISPTSRGRVTASLPHGSASINWIDVDLTAFADFSTASHISTVTFARLRIPSLLANVTGRILYLDSDLLVLNSLRPLWELNLNGAVLGASLDSGINAMIERKDDRLAAIPRVQKYFNAGVLLIDLDQWRLTGIVESALEYLGRNPKSPFSDQDALNVACDGRWHNLGERWNYQAYRHLEAVTSLPPEAQPAVVHFVMSNKPWHYTELHKYAAYFDGIRKQTAFAQTPTESCRTAIRIAWMHLKRRSRQILSTLRLCSPRDQ